MAMGRFSTKPERRQSLPPSPRFPLRSHSGCLHLFSTPYPLAKTLTFRCSALPRDEVKPLLCLHSTVFGVTELLRLLSPRIQRSSAAIALSVASIANDRCVEAQMRREMQKMRLLRLIAWML